MWSSGVTIQWNNSSSHQLIDMCKVKAVIEF
ncbi:hypothetical protein BS78_K003700 [Paspalum vaginatum]|uniref:Uncharacterized protein n=1 Tax=Paspalum vaginatum TaxID=158149 RepID=A0A9W7XAS7_9POAL|nr:hypothetical protein BS78_K264400 [Paspalum vaginatum]KAJ1256573.1 hypothetical protein BS78_K003700 [Paspalum vaginatum]